MFKNRSKLIAIFTGVISVLICVIYLILITVFDFRSLLNNYLSNESENLVAVSYLFDFFCEFSILK